MPGPRGQRGKKCGWGRGNSAATFTQGSPPTAWVSSLPRCFSRSLSREWRSTAFLQSHSSRLAPRLRPDPIWSPGGREREVPTCTCSSGDRLRPGPPPPAGSPAGQLLLGSGCSNHLANHQQVGRCLFLRPRRKGQCAGLSSRGPTSRRLPSSASREEGEL
jgi:hypothetical protein